MSEMEYVVQATVQVWIVGMGEPEVQASQVHTASFPSILLAARNLSVSGLAEDMLKRLHRERQEGDD